MRKKFKILLSLLALLLVATLSVGTGYGVWLSSKQTEDTNTMRIDCFKIYYENDGIIEMSKIKPVVNIDGEETSPYTITVTNTCIEPKEMQIRLNVVESTTIDINALTLKTSGNISNDTILYKNLETTKTEEEGIVASKLIGKTVVQPNETVRTNMRIWFDERKVPIVNEKNNYFKGHIEIINTDNAIKPTLQEIIVKDKTSIENKGNPEFTAAEYKEAGVYAIDAPGGKYYYYRGVVNNNYVKFGNELWRIMGVNPDGTIKLITEVPITIDVYSNNYNKADFVGYEYTLNRVTMYNDYLNTINEWYRNNIEYSLDNYVVQYNFCNDTSSRTTNNKTYFGAYDRLFSDVAPIATCPSTKNNGGVYNQKVGLVTADEVTLAGGLQNTTNTSYYLYNGTSFWTASAAEFTSGVAQMVVVNSDGTIAEERVDTSQGIRPVINIVGNLTFEGSGTKDNPYILDLE